MSESSKPFSQDDSYPDENLLEGFQRLVPTPHHLPDPLRLSQTEGSMLLDSINSYIHDSEKIIVAIQEAAEQEQEAGPPLHLPPLTADQLPSSEPIEAAGSRSVRNLPQTHPTESLEPAEQAGMVVCCPQPAPETVQPSFSLGFSHYNSRNEESISKTDLNQSLLVECSNYKQTENNLENQRPPQGMPEGLANPAINEGFAITNHNTVTDTVQQDQPPISAITYYSKQLSDLAPSEEAKPAEDIISNGSIDSSKLATLLPLYCLPSERYTERIEQTEYEHQNSQSALKNCEGEIEYMDIEGMKMREAEVPMEIEFIPQRVECMDIEGVLPENHLIPMDIEPVGFPYCSNEPPQYLNTITLEPIKQGDSQPLVEQQRAQEQEMLDSISFPRVNHQTEPYKEFTFGKEEVEHTLYDQLKEEQLKNKQDEPMPHPEEANHSKSKLAQLEALASAEGAQDSSYWYQLREENMQSLSMNVEHDNNFSNTLREADDIFGIPAKKDEEADMSIVQNEPILHNLLVESIDQRQEHVPYSNFKADSSYEQVIQPVININEEESRGLNTAVILSEGFGREQSISFVPFREEQLIIQEDPTLERMVIELAPQENITVHFKQKDVSLQNDKIEVYDSEPLLMKPKSPQKETNIQRFSRCTFNSNVFNFTQRSQELIGRQPVNEPTVLVEQSHPHQQANLQQSRAIEVPQPIVDLGMMANPATGPWTSAQNSNVYSLQQYPQIAFQPITSVPVQPWMTISYKMNEASINIFGPATTSSPNRQETLSNITVSNNESTDIIKKKPQQQRDSPIIQNVRQSVIIEQASRLEAQQNQEKPFQQPINVEFPKRQFISSAIQTSEPIKVIRQQMSKPEVLVEDIAENCQNVIRQAENYLLKFEYTNEILHKDFERLVNQYVILRFAPEPKNEIGGILFKNGLFLIAIVKLVTRASPTPFITNYMYQFLENAYGNVLERSNYVFRSECQKAKSSYQAVMESKYNDMLANKIGQDKEKKAFGEPIKRNCITKNIFYSLHGERVPKQELGFQTEPQRPKTPERLERPLPKKEAQFEKIEKSAQVNISVSIQSKSKQAPQPKKSQIINQENVSANRSPPKQKSKEKKAEVKESPAQKPNNPQKLETPAASGSKVIPRQIKLQEQTKDISNKKEKAAEIKKNIEEIKNSFGSYGRKAENAQVDSSSMNNKISDLYNKYRTIAGKRQSSNSDLPIDNSSVKKTLVTQVTKEKEKEQKQPEKKAQKKLTVGFVDQLKVNTEGEDDTDEEMVKRRQRPKKKTTKPKKDVSVDSSEQEEPDQVRTRRTTSKKEK